MTNQAQEWMSGPVLLTGRWITREAGPAIAWFICERHPGRTVGWIRKHTSGRIRVGLMSAYFRPAHPGGLMTWTEGPEPWLIVDLAEFTDGTAYCLRCGLLDVPAELLRTTTLGTPREPASIRLSARKR